MFDPFKFASERFPSLAAKDVASLIKTSKVVRLKAGETFIKQGERNPQSGFIISGIMRAYCIVDGYKEVSIIFRGVYEFIGSIPAMMFDEVADEQVEALEDTVLFVFDYANFRSLAKSNTGIAKAHSRVMEILLKDAISRIHDFAILSPEERYVKLIKENKKLVQRVPLKYLASYLGITEVSLSRIRGRISKNKS